jgi:hypothetical protein
MPCIVKKTFEAALSSGNDLIVQVKDNQSGLVGRLETCIAETDGQSTDRTLQEARNRQEERIVTVYDPAKALAGTDWGPLIKSLIVVQRRTKIYNPANGLWRSREEVAYYVASYVAPAQTFAKAIRAHWGIENRNHYVRDVTLGEDKSRIRVNPGVMARLRSFTLNILRANGAENIAKTLWLNAINPLAIMRYKGISLEK